MAGFVAIHCNSLLKEYFKISEIVNYLTALNDKLQWLDPWMIYLYTTMLALSGRSIDDNDDDNVLKQIPEHNVTHHLCATDDLLFNFSALSALATPINENIRY